MPKQSKSQRVVVERHGRECVLLSVAENGNGDLILNLYLKQLGGGVPDPFLELSENDRGKEIEEYRFTVHRSQESEISNTITLHLKYAGGEYSKNYFNTTALKSNSGFSPVYARLCSAMDDAGYDVKPNKTPSVKLGKMDDGFSLVFMIFIGPPKVQFPLSPSNGNVKTLDFEHFGLTIMWSYLTISPTSHGRLASMHSNPEGGAVQGWPPETCVLFFDQVRSGFKDYTVQVLSQRADLSAFVRMMAASIYVPRAEQTSPEFERWMMAMIRLGLAP